MTFIERKKFQHLPDDARELTATQVADFYSIVIDTWKKPFEIWALNFAPHIIGGASAVTGFYFNMYFRKKLTLRRYGYVATYLPNVAIPFVTTVSSHKMVNQGIP